MPFKIDFVDGAVDVWTVTGDGAAVDRDDHYTPSLYVGARDDDRDKLSAVANALTSDPKVVATAWEEWFTSLRSSERSTVLRVDVDRIGAVRQLGQELKHVHESGSYGPGVLECYNTDLAPQFRYCLERDVSPVPNEDLTRMRLGLPDQAIANRDLGPLTIDGEEVTGPNSGVIVYLEDEIQTTDPDILQVSSAQIIPLVYDLADELGIDPPVLGRREGYDQLAGRSSFSSYGRVGHSPARFNLPGRVIIDESNSFMLDEAGLDGILDLVERSHRPLQETAWGSIGTILTAIQTRKALDRDVLIPAQKTQHEFFKSASKLHNADRGGFTFDPEVGLFEDVYELDFASLYPNIMIQYNVSPETVQCECHRDRADVPELGYSICDERGFIPDVLEPIVDDRSAIKAAIAKTEDEDRIATLEARSDALKWILVCCFGYQGYENSKFGRIEAHEAISAYARDILLTAKEYFENGGWRIVHGIVDSIWVQPIDGAEQQPLEEVAQAISDAVEIELEFEHEYDWICFVPRRTSDAGALTKYFGRDVDGEWKIRGIETRQRSTPAWIADRQEDLMATLGETQDPEAVCDHCRRFISDLHAGRVDPEDLVIRKRVSKPLEAYTQETKTVAALRRYEDLGVSKHPGQDVKYVVVDDGAMRSAQRVRVSFEEPTECDADWYADQLIRACESVLSPVGWDRSAIEYYFRETRTTSLESYG
jgi:DNA polymerase I